MVGRKKLLFLVALIALALTTTACIGSWSQTSWQVPLKLRLLEDNVTADELLADNGQSGWTSEGDGPLTYKVEEGPFTVESDVSLQLGAIEEDGTYLPTSDATAFQSFSESPAVVEQRFPLGDLFELEDYEVHAVTLTQDPNNLITVTIDPPSFSIEDAWLESDDSLSLWSEADQAIDLGGQTLMSGDAIVFQVEVASDDPTAGFTWTVRGDDFVIDSATVSLEDTVDVDLDAIQLDLDFDETIKEILQGIDDFHGLALVLTIDQDTGLEVSGFENLVFSFDGQPAIVNIDSTTLGSETVVTVSGPGLWQAVKEFPDILEIAGPLTISGEKKVLAFQYDQDDNSNQWVGSLSIMAELTLETRFEADFDSVERYFYTDAATVQANPNFVDDTADLGDMVLFAAVKNSLPIGVNVVLQWSSDESFDTGMDELLVGSIPANNQAEVLEIFVGDEIEDLIQNGGFIRARLELQGSGSMIVRGSDQVDIRAWVEASIPVSFDSEE